MFALKWTLIKIENEELCISIRIDNIYEKAITQRLSKYINGKRKLY